MPTEVRRITFQPDELTEALQAHAAVKLSELGPVELSFIKANGSGDQLQIVAGQAAASEALRLETDEVGAALVRYCLDRGIPIPQKAVRSLSINKGKLALHVHLDEEAEESHVQLPDYYEYDFYG